MFEVTFIIVDVSTQYPLFGRDWMSLLEFDVSALIQEATQVCSTSKLKKLSQQNICVVNMPIFSRKTWEYCRGLRLQLVLI